MRGDDNRVNDVFRHEIASGRTTLVSRGRRGRADDRSDAPVVSADGRYVAFTSEASNLRWTTRGPRSMADLNLVADVYLFDAVTDTITRVSGWDAAGGPWWEPSLGPALDASGRVIAFSTRHPIDDRDVDAAFDLIVRRIDEINPGSPSKHSR